ncbi:MAG: hypothetical protein NXH89_21380, partial [Cyclobacteriaceae bacterium]|nr:hypothetical protein [Cyclobacteriaceae bacterium]
IKKLIGPIDLFSHGIVELMIKSSPSSLNISKGLVRSNFPRKKRSQLMEGLIQINLQTLG